MITGGIIKDWGTNARIGEGEWFIVEADESDETFVKLPTDIGVVTNIDPEHLDYYGSVEAMHDAYQRFFSGIQPGGAGRRRHRSSGGAPIRREPPRCPKAAGCCAMASPTMPMSGSTARAHRMAARCISMPRSSGAVKRGARRMDDLTLAVPGRYNALNAMAAIAVAKEAGIDDKIIREALASFQGVKRRFTRTGVWNGVAIYDDYAHHPAEISAVLDAARGATRGRVIAIVQPHRYSRLKSLFDEFCSCFGQFRHGHRHAGLFRRRGAERRRPRQADRRACASSGHRQVLPVDGEEGLPA